MAPEVHGLLDTNILILRRQIDHSRLPDTMSHYGPAARTEFGTTPPGSQRAGRRA